MTILTEGLVDRILKLVLKEKDVNEQQPTILTDLFDYLNGMRTGVDRSATNS